MGLSCGVKCAKWTLFAFNLIFFLGGAVILALGIWIRVDTASFAGAMDRLNPTSESSYLANNPIDTNLAPVHIAAYVLIAVGGFALLTGFMGCCGACQEWRWLLVIYAICLILVLGVEIAVGITAGVFKLKVREKIRYELNKMAESYDYINTTLVDDNRLIIAKTNAMDPNNLKQTVAWNAIQTRYGCCGVDNYTDFFGSPYQRNGGEMFVPPVYCCRFTDYSALRLLDSSCYNSSSRLDDRYSNYNTGCFTKLSGFFENNLPAVIGVAIGIGLLELFGVFFAFCLCHAIGQKYKTTTTKHVEMARFTSR